MKQLELPIVQDAKWCSISVSSSLYFQNMVSYNNCQITRRSIEIQ